MEQRQGVQGDWKIGGEGGLVKERMGQMGE